MRLNYLNSRRKKYFFLTLIEKIQYLDEFIAVNAEIVRLKHDQCQYDFDSDLLYGMIYCPWPIDIEKMEVQLNERGFYCAKNTR